MGDTVERNVDATHRWLYDSRVSCGPHTNVHRIAELVFDPPPPAVDAIPVAAGKLAVDQRGEPRAASADRWLNLAPSALG